jgi:hypothetical protein
MMDKIQAILFLTRVFFFVIIKIIRGKTWNTLIADLEEEQGRVRYTYTREAKYYILRADP